MNVINFGSLNLDHVYEVEHLVRPGETITAWKYQLSCGGKGLNQSVALAHAAANVFHAGKIGQDGELLLAGLRAAGVNTRYVEVAENEPSGHAIIQVDKNGQNAIIIHGGANQSIQKEYVKRVLGHFESGDYLLVQNTAAGDTFIGFFVAQMMNGNTIESCLRTASRAAAICVTRRGAADSIPLGQEVI